MKSTFLSSFTPSLMTPKTLEAIFVQRHQLAFDGLGDIGQKQLRAYLQNYSFCTILATAQSLFDGVRLQDYPFYGFFCPHYLDAISNQYLWVEVSHQSLSRKITTVASISLRLYLLEHEHSRL